MSKSPDRIAGMFDAIAGQVRLPESSAERGHRSPVAEAGDPSLALTGSERVLDLCTGTADLAIAAIDARPGAARVVGVDFAAAMLASGGRSFVSVTSIGRSRWCAVMRRVFRSRPDRSTR